MPDRAQQERERKLEAELRGQAASYRRLSPDEERAFLRDVPSQEASRALVEHNLDLVVEQADAHKGQGLAFSDLYQEGTVGLVDAIAAYTGNGGFREFAGLHIGLQMDSLVRAEADARKETEDDVKDVRLLQTAQIMFRQKNRREPTAAELQKALGWDEGRLERVDRMLQLAQDYNDAATINFLDASDADELGIDFGEPEEQPDPRRKLEGYGPDE